VRAVIRVIMIFLIILTVFISGFALLCALGIVSESQFGALTYSFYDNLGTRMIVALACVFVILISLVIMLFRPSPRSSKRSARILTSRNGAIKISHRAIKEIVSNYIHERSDVITARIKVRGGDDGIDVLTIIVLKGSKSILSLTQELENGIKEVLAERCGIKVNGVEVFIDRIRNKK